MRLKRKMVCVIIFAFIVTLLPPAPILTDLEVDARVLVPEEGKIELEAERTDSTKIYLKSDGSKELHSFQGPVHYQTIENGKDVYKEIDTSLVGNIGLVTEDFGWDYTNKANDFSLKISKSVAGKLYSLERDGVSATFSLSGIANNVNESFDINRGSRAEKNENAATFKNVTEDTDFTIYSMASGAKEYITLNEYNGQNTFKFTVETDGGYIEKDKESDTFKLYKEGTKDVVFDIPEFFMWDNRGGEDSEENSYSYDVEANLSQGTDGKYEFEIKADDKWLSSEDRVFPVIIDPSFTKYVREDTYVQQGYPTTKAYGQRAIYVGRGATKLRARGFINFSLPDLRGARIYGATFQALQYANCSGSCTWSGVRAYTTKSYNPWGIYWNNHPGLVSRITTPQNATKWGWFKFNVTNAAKQWFYNSSSPSYIGALSFIQNNENYWGYRTWASSEHPSYAAKYQPRLIISYNDYDASYYPTDVPEMFAGSEVDVPVTVVNEGRNTWYKDGSQAFKMSYHWVNNETGEETVKNGVRTTLPHNVGPRGGKATVLTKVNAPTISGKYTLKWEMVHEGVTWFSTQGVATKNMQVNVSPQTFASQYHLGSEPYYTKAGPVDMYNGNFTMNKTDVAVNSQTGILNFSRYYNSADLDNTFSHLDSGLINKWLVNGPYKASSFANTLPTEFIRNEGSIRPSDGSTSDSNVWFDVEGDAGRVVYNTILDDQMKVYESDRMVYTTMYNHVYVYSPTERDAQLRMGSNDGIKAWVNGDLIVENNIIRTLGTNFDAEVHSIKLNEGWNSLMIKCSNSGGGWGFAAYITDSSGNKIDDLRYELNNPEMFNQGVMGDGWTTTLDERLDVQDEENVYYKDSTGTVHVYSKNSAGVYATPAGVALDLRKNEDETFTLYNRGGLEFSFNAEGKVLKKMDASGNSLNYSYDEQERCVKISDGKDWYERWIQFIYNEDGTLASSGDNRNKYQERLIKYVYQDGKLVKVHDLYSNPEEYIYGPSGNIESYKDLNGSEYRIEYQDGRVAKLVDALGGESLFSYSKNYGQVTDPLGRVNKFKFSGANLMSNYENTKGYKEFYVYNKNFDTLKVFPNLDANSMYYYSVDYVYNNDGNVTSITYPDGTKTTSAYSGINLTSTTDPEGNTSKFEYTTDGRSLVSKEIDAEGKFVTYTYDDRGNVLTKIDSEGKTLTYTYTKHGYVETEKDSKGQVTKFAYSNIGQKTKEISPLGNTKVFNYDLMGRLSRIVDPDGEVNRLVYDKNGNKLKEVDPNGRAKLYEYDALNRLAKVTDRAGATIQYKYDAVGNMIEKINHKGESTRYEFDELNKLVKETAPDGKVTTAEYDRNGKLINITDPFGEESGSEYDKSGNLVKATDTESTTEIEYDKNGNVIEASSRTNKLVKVYENDYTGQMDGMDPRSGNWFVEEGVLRQDTVEPAYVNSYFDGIKFGDGEIKFRAKRDNSGYPYFRLVFRDQDDIEDNGGYYYVGFIGNHWRICQSGDDARRYPATMNVGQWYSVRATIVGENVKLYVDDKLIMDENLVGGVDAGSMRLMTYTMDASFDDIEIYSSSDSVNYTYDRTNVAVAEESEFNGETARVYDDAGNLDEVKTETATIDFDYDANDNVVGVSTSLDNLNKDLGKATLDRDAEGKITKVVNANGDITLYQYDNTGRVISSSIKNKYGVTLKTFSYGYDANSNITSVTNEDGSVQSYEYDARNQLTKDNLATYQYDISGNRTSMITASGTVGYQYDGDKLIKVTNPDGRTLSFEYDARGNVSRKIDSVNGETTYSYDNEDKFTKAILPSGKIIEYVYEAVSGRRVQRIETETDGSEFIIKFFYEGDLLVSETDIRGNILKAYTWDENESLLSVTMRNEAGELETYYYLRNFKGDIVGMTDGEGNKVVAYKYDSWGNNLESTVLSESVPSDLDTQNTRLYSGYWYDHDLGQYFMKIRMYDPEVGRFYAQDPVIAHDGALAENPYIYCENNPINNIDPSGKFSIWGGIKNFAKNTASTVAKAYKAVSRNVKKGYNHMKESVQCFASNPKQYLKDAWNYSAVTRGALIVGGAAVVAGLAIGGYYAASAIVSSATVSAISAKIATISAPAIGVIKKAATKIFTPRNKEVIYMGIRKGKLYVGRTNDFARRSAEHLKHSGMKIEKVWDNLSPRMAKALEQQYIESMGGKQVLANHINGIAESNSFYNTARVLGKWWINTLGIHPY